MMLSRLDWCGCYTTLGASLAATEKDAEMDRDAGIDVLDIAGFYR
jgi:hypothetical protein